MDFVIAIRLGIVVNVIESHNMVSFEIGGKIATYDTKINHFSAF